MKNLYGVVIALTWGLGLGAAVCALGFTACGAGSKKAVQTQIADAAPQADPPRGRAKHTLQGHPIIERDGKTQVWARGNPRSKDSQWFDVTDSLIDPQKWNYGIGKDRIAAIDHPVFADLNDPRLKKAGIDDRTIVIGYAAEGQARAYPLNILNRHELVNDKFGDKPVTVGW